MYIWLWYTRMQCSIHQAQVAPRSGLEPVNVTSELYTT